MNIHYPSFNREQITQNNLLLGAEFCWQQNNSPGFSWNIKVSNTLPACQAINYLRCYVDGCEMMFGFNENLLNLCCDGLPQANRLPQEFQLALLVNAIEPILQQVFAPAAVALEKSAYASSQTQDTWVELPVLLSNKAGQGLGLIRLPQTQSLDWLQLWQGTQPVKSLDALPFLMRIICAQTQLSLGELNRVEVDDIVFLDRVYDRQNGVKVAIEGVGNGLAIYHDGQLKFSQELEYDMPNDQQTMESNYSDGDLSFSIDNNTLSSTEQHQSCENSSEQTANGVTPLPLDSLNVTLSFELAKQPITLAQLQRVGPGYCFDLGLDLKAPISIIVQGRCLGRCELIEVDQRLGARIVDWHGCGAKA